MEEKTIVRAIWDLGRLPTNAAMAKLLNVAITEVDGALGAHPRIRKALLRKAKEVYPDRAFKEALSNLRSIYLLPSAVKGDIYRRLLDPVIMHDIEQFGNGVRYEDGRRLVGKSLGIEGGISRDLMEARKIACPEIRRVCAICLVKEDLTSKERQLLPPRQYRKWSGPCAMCEGSLPQIAFSGRRAVSITGRG